MRMSTGIAVLGREHRDRVFFDVCAVVPAWERREEAGETDLPRESKI